MEIRKAVARFVRDEAGATAAEYALLAALIAVVIIAGARALGIAINASLSDSASDVAAV